VEKPGHVRQFHWVFQGALQADFGREVRLEFEDERALAGIVHDSMFEAAYRADVFIANLTGAGIGPDLTVNSSCSTDRRSSMKAFSTAYSATLPTTGCSPNEAV
jgi:hypothetical protein